MKLLHKTAQKSTKYIIGLMSGTSLDGLDIALCKIEGSGVDTKLTLCEFKTVAYPPKINHLLRACVSVNGVVNSELTALNTMLGDYFAQSVLEALEEWDIDAAEIDCIASHGQTIYHAPASAHKDKDWPNATLQMGDGDHIARKTGILTISDFRQKHTAVGGEGAPMAALVDELIFGNKNENRILLNIGGMANFTRLSSNGETVTSDTGPGNTLINKIMQKLFNQPFDKDGKTAEYGSVHPDLLEKLLTHPFFEAEMPKSTGPEMFDVAWVKKQQRKTGTAGIRKEDLIATLTRLTAQTVVDAIVSVSEESSAEIYLSGGGMHNNQLVEWIEELLGQEIHSFKEIGFNPDAKEAACFAVLANETLSGDGFEVNGKKVNFGKISLPV